MFKKKFQITLFKVIVSASVLTVITSSPADAYFKLGRIWTSTANSKYPTVFSGVLSAGQISTANAMNQKWGGLANSNLNTGNLFVTSSLSAYENAAFKMWKEDNYFAYGDSSPALTFYCVGCDSARVVLSTRWVWTTYFQSTPNNPSSFGYADSATVILHEFGHAYGLDHPDNDPVTALTSAEIASVMYPNFTIKRNLTQDDINGIASMY